MVHVRKGVTLDVENQTDLRDPIEEDILMPASEDTVQPAPVVESVPNTGLQSGSLQNTVTRPAPQSPDTRHIPDPARDEPVNQGGGDESRITTRSHPIPSAKYSEDNALWACDSKTCSIPGSGVMKLWRGV